MIIALVPLALFGVLGLAAVVLIHELAEIVVIANGVRAGRADRRPLDPAASHPRGTGERTVVTAGPTSPEARVRRARITLVATVVIVAALDLGLKTWAGRTLNDGSSIDLGPLNLRLAFNPGGIQFRRHPAPRLCSASPASSWSVWRCSPSA
ncbi:hypothetical protein MARA_03900 [Mycolicibacterium arabiense]|uniref:Lipoprotein signal peptidase n=1 Tax=Mycolicibacterium arabiense TaxID=1286181 RepID=A0A7I7RQU0_9MYCO|nr:hypothetical protein MARA_03900 [Mycolicibacterium arabiense]